MSDTYNAYEALLGRLESVAHTEETTPVAGDYLPAVKGFELTYQPKAVDVNFAKDTMGPSPKVMVPDIVPVKFQIPIVPTGSTITCAAHNILKCGGFGYTITTNKQTYTLSSAETNRPGMTLWHDSGNMTASSSLRTTLKSVMYDIEIGGKIGDICYITANGKGIPGATPAQAVTFISTGFSLLDSATITAISKASTMTVAGQTVKLVEFKCKTNAKLVPIPGNDACGYIGFQISDFSPVVECEFWQEALGNTITAAMIAETPTTFVYTYGTAGSRVTVRSTGAATPAQVIKLDSGDIDGIRTYKATLQFNGIDLTVIVNDD
jgi:hypothetical protein